LHDVYSAFGLQVLMLNLGDPVAAVEAFAADNELTTTILLDGQEVYGWFGDDFTPYNVYLDTSLVVRFTHSEFNLDYRDQWIDLTAQYGHTPPYPFLENAAFTLTGNLNDDDRPDPGEFCRLRLRISNRRYFSTGRNLAALLQCSDPALQMVDSLALFPDCPPDSSVHSLDSLSFLMVDDFTPHFATLRLTITGDSLPEPFTTEFPLRLGRPPLLLVDDDNWAVTDTFITRFLEDGGHEVDVWSESDTTISQEELQRYRAVIWNNGRSWFTLDSTERVRVQDYLEQGGKLLFSSQYGAENINDSLFLAQVLHARRINDNTQVDLVDGIPGAPLGEDLLLNLAGGDGDDDNESPNSMEAVFPAVPWLQYRDLEEYAAIAWSGQSGGQLLFLGFPLESVGGAAGSATGTEFLEVCLQWFQVPDGWKTPTPVMPLTPVPARLYPNPFNPATRLEVILPVPGPVRLSLFDLRGRLVFRSLSGWLEAGEQQLNIPGEGLAAGLYLLEARFPESPGLAPLHLKALLVK
jgi:hypothetical protein